MDVELVWGFTDPTRLPLFVALASFVLVFLTPRVVTRLIRSGRARGPIRNTVIGELHVHHAVLGVILLVAGGFMGLTELPLLWRCVAGAIVGAGASLVLDEFGNILHLDDVYWRDEGRKSVQVVALTIVALCAHLIGLNPFGVDNLTPESSGARVVLTALVALSIVCVFICAYKGKYRIALVAVFVPVIAYVCAIRLARPDSPWARRFYGPEKLARAQRRAVSFDRWTNPVWFKVGDFIAGGPTDVRTRTPLVEDLAQLAEVEAAADTLFERVMDTSTWPKPMSGQERAAMPGILLVVGHPVVGFAHVMEVGGHWYLDQLSVHPRAQSQGIGGALLDAAGAAVLRCGGQRVSLRTYANVPWNAPFYAKHGFLVMERSPEWMAPAIQAEDRLDLRAGGPRVSMVRLLGEAGEVSSSAAARAVRRGRGRVAGPRRRRGSPRARKRPAGGRG